VSPGMCCCVAGCVVPKRCKDCRGFVCKECKPLADEGTAVVRMLGTTHPTTQHHIQGDLNPLKQQREKLKYCHP